MVVALFDKLLVNESSDVTATGFWASRLVEIRVKNISKVKVERCIATVLWCKVNAYLDLIQIKIKIILNKRQKN